MSDDQILELLEEPIPQHAAFVKAKSTRKSRNQSTPRQAAAPSQRKNLDDVDAGEEEFWDIVD